MEAVRYLLRRRPLSVPQCKQFSLMISREIVSMLLCDLHRVRELHDKGLALGEWSVIKRQLEYNIAVLGVTEQELISIVLQQLAHKTLKEADAGRLHPEVCD